MTEEKRGDKYKRMFTHHIPRKRAPGRNEIEANPEFVAKRRRLDAELEDKAIEREFDWFSE